MLFIQIPFTVRDLHSHHPELCKLHNSHYSMLCNSNCWYRDKWKFIQAWPLGLPKRWNNLPNWRYSEKFSQSEVERKL